MNRIIHTALSYGLALVTLLSGSIMTPEAVLCVGPGNHCHLETVVGTSCNSDVPAAHGSAPQPQDGCPRGSKDFRLTVDTHRTDNTCTIATFVAAALLVASGIELQSYPPSIQFLSRLPIPQMLQHSTIVLRC